MKTIKALIAPLIFIFLLTSFHPIPPLPSRDDNMAMGNPSDAKTAVSSPDNYLMIKTQYALSYNSTKGIPNWVSWHLSTAWRGKFKRADPFKADPSVPAAWYHVAKTDYATTGFDRGHMCPSADRNNNKIDNDATFFMTNMVPQSPVCNRQTWGDLEDYCRELTDAGNELYIIAGPSGKKGTGSEGSASAIAEGKVQVPKFVWKVILVLPVGANDVGRVTEGTRVIAVKLPNKENVNIKEWYDYRTTIDEIEKLTGYDFFSAIDDVVENKIEKKLDDVEID